MTPARRGLRFRRSSSSVRVFAVVARRQTQRSTRSLKKSSGVADDLTLLEDPNVPHTLLWVFSDGNATELSVLASYGDLSDAGITVGLLCMDDNSAACSGTPAPPVSHDMRHG